MAARAKKKATPRKRAQHSRSGEPVVLFAKKGVRRKQSVLFVKDESAEKKAN